MAHAFDISNRIEEASEGSVFIASDFADLAGDAAIRKVLSRMVADGRLERPVRGIYRKPHTGALSTETANPDEIARAVARKFGWNIAPANDTALGLLGLGTENPNSVCYVSDGPYRSYEYDRFKIEFRHTANKDLSNMSAMTALVVQAMRAIGESDLTPDMLEVISSKLDKNQLEIVLAETRTATVWIREAIKHMAETGAA